MMTQWCVCLPQGRLSPSHTCGPCLAHARTGQWPGGRRSEQQRAADTAAHQRVSTSAGHTPTGSNNNNNNNKLLLCMNVFIYNMQVRT